MSNIQPGPDGKPKLVLPAILDLTAAQRLREDLLASLQMGEGLELDASQVQRVSSLCLQILASAARSFRETGGPGLSIAAASDGFRDAAFGLDLAHHIGLPGEN
jgi:anti-anti-sigma regulatory factor